MGKVNLEESAKGIKIRKQTIVGEYWSILCSLSVLKFLIFYFKRRRSMRLE